MHTIVTRLAWFCYSVVILGAAWLAFKFGAKFAPTSLDAIVYGLIAVALVICVSLLLVFTEGAWTAGKKSMAALCGACAVAILSLTLTMSVGTLGANRTNVVNEFTHKAKLTKNAEHNRERIEVELAALASTQPIDRAMAAVQIIEGSPAFKDTKGCTDQRTGADRRVCARWSKAKGELGTATRRETLERELRTAEKTMETNGPEVVADGQTFVLASLTGADASTVRNAVVAQWGAALALAEFILMRVLFFLHGVCPSALFRIGQSAPRQPTATEQAQYAAHFAPPTQHPTNIVRETYMVDDEEAKRLRSQYEADRAAREKQAAEWAAKWGAALQLKAA
jgi:hypothetical protein